MATKEEITKLIKKNAHNLYYDWECENLAEKITKLQEKETKELKQELKETEADLTEAYRLGNLMEQQLTEANALIEKMHNVIFFKKSRSGYHLLLEDVIKSHYEYKTKQTTQEVTKP